MTTTPQTVTDRYGVTHRIRAIHRYGPMLHIRCGTDDNAYTMVVHHTKVTLR